MTLELGMNLAKELDVCLESWVRFFNEYTGVSYTDPTFLRNEKIIKRIWEQ